MALTFVPQVGQNLSNTQAPILANFTFINNNFNEDHVVFNSGADSGKHKKITFPVLYSTTGTMPTFGVDERGLFAAQTTLTGVNEIFVWKSASFGGGLGSQRFSITQNRGNISGEVAASYTVSNTAQYPNTTGYSMLPNGIFLQWMVVDFTAGATQRSFNWPIPFVGYVFNVQISQYNTSNTGLTVTYHISTSVADVLSKVTITQSNTLRHYYMVFAIGTRY